MGLGGGELALLPEARGVLSATARTALLPAALRKLRGWADVEDEMEEMRVEDQAEKAEGRLSVLNLFTFRPLRWQLLSIIVLMAGQQLSGINAVRGHEGGLCASRPGGAWGGRLALQSGYGGVQVLAQNFWSTDSHVIRSDPANVH